MGVLEMLINSSVYVLSNTTHSVLNTTTLPLTTSTANSTLTSTMMTTNQTTLSSSMSTVTSTHLLTNGTTGFIPMTTETPDTPPGYVGFLTAGLAILLYGTNFAPVKKFETGDGMFFQWILCVAIWMTGLVVQLIRHSPEFYPICMVGGVLWETGNICVVPIVKTIGLGLGLCIWGMTNLLSGWATGRYALFLIYFQSMYRFGLFGVDKETLSNYTLNDVGVCLAVLSAVIFSMVKNTVDGSHDGDIEIVDENSPLIQDDLTDTDSSYTNSIKDTHETIVINENSNKTTSSINQKEGISAETEDDGSFIDKLSPTSKRIVGVTLSIVSGVMYGQMFTPAKYLQDHGHSTNGLDYVFSTFCGILATSTVYFLVYAAFRKNKPKIYANVILPGFVSGIMWGVATSSWFVANKILSNSVSFPIVTTGPAVVASLLGVLVFGEITGKKNIMVLSLGMAVTITGSILSGLSF